MSDHTGSPQSTEPSSSYINYASYPVRHVVGSVFRRLSTDPQMTPQLSARRNSDLIDFGSDDAPIPSSSPIVPTTAPTLQPPVSYTPPPRIEQSYTPPPLTPLSLNGTRDGSEPSSGFILSRALAEEIRLLVPTRLELVDTWNLVFSLEQHGSSLATLFEKCAALRGKRGGFVVAVKDGSNNIFGAYLNETPRPSNGHYYGNGECFLWRSSVLSAIPDLSSLPPPPSADTTNLQRMTTVRNPSFQGGRFSRRGTPDGTSTPDRMRFKAFPYSGLNDYMIFCEQKFLSVGGGDGHYGLWIDSSLDTGLSSPCPTFGNEQLSDDGKKFDIMAVEVWYIGASGA